MLPIISNCQHVWTYPSNHVVSTNSLHFSKVDLITALMPAAKASQVKPGSIVFWNHTLCRYVHTAVESHVVGMLSGELAVVVQRMIRSLLFALCQQTRLYRRRRSHYVIAQGELRPSPFFQHQRVFCGYDNYNLCWINISFEERIVSHSHFIDCESFLKGQIVK